MLVTMADTKPLPPGMMAVAVFGGERDSLYDLSIVKTETSGGSLRIVWDQTAQPESEGCSTSPYVIRLVAASTLPVEFQKLGNPTPFPHDLPRCPSPDKVVSRHPLPG